MRGCFGGCTFCSITEHEGRIIQSRSQQSIIDEIEDIKETISKFELVFKKISQIPENNYKNRLEGNIPTPIWTQKITPTRKLK